MNMGNIMFLGGIIGTVVCIVLLFFLPHIFSKQKKKLYEQIIQED